jgi:GNAT superfamily N-acetyltransferase
VSGERWEIRAVEGDEEVRRCFPVLSQLRPQLTEAELVPRVRRMRESGFLMAALWEDGEPRAVAGYRYLDQFHLGLTLYVDDLVTDGRHRSRGHGAALLGWLREQARSRGCAALTLDSGVHRTEAHRFYFRERMSIASFHFVERLEPAGPEG